MAEYCTTADLQKRITETGILYGADSDDTGTLSDTEEADFVTRSIQWAGEQIDFALTTWVSPANARAQSNVFLRELCVDLAAERFASIGGRGVPAAIEMFAERARDVLQRLSRGQKVPNLVYPQAPSGDSRTDATRSWPRVVNYRGAGRGRTTRRFR